LYQNLENPSLVLIFPLPEDRNLFDKPRTEISALFLKIIRPLVCRRRSVFNVHTREKKSLLPRQQQKQQMSTVPGSTAKPTKTPKPGGHLWDLQETRRYSIPPSNMNAFSEYLQRNHFSIKNIDNKQLKAVGSTTPNVNWKVSP